MTEQNWKIGDCQDLMKEMEPDSVDLIVTDPPYGYSFMGKDWDRAVPTVNLWQETLRVLKPGAFAFIMSAPRQDVLAHNLVNLSDAGFDTSFTSIYWTYASGFPKASNIGKMVDKRLGAERPKTKEIQPRSTLHGDRPWLKKAKEEGSYKVADNNPITSQAKELEGSYGGFQPKPAVEIIMVVMKPLSEKTSVDQAMTNQKGITWLDDGRIPYQNDDDIKNATPFSPNNIKTGIFGKLKKRDNVVPNSKGRFPANLLVCDDVLNDGNVTKNSDVIRHNNQDLTSGKGIYGKYNQKDTYGYSDSGSFSRYFDLDAWFEDQIKYLPKKVKETFPFIITPKANKSEKIGSTHPTVKPVKLFTYLITIGSRSDDLVLDPFLGSGTTLKAGRLTNRSVMGFELDPQWEPLYNSRAMKNTPSLLSFG